MTTMSFVSDKRFNDFQHFPRGLRRSGEFTVAEANTLEQCGHVMLELYQGKREPQDEIEKAFIEPVRQLIEPLNWSAPGNWWNCCSVSTTPRLYCWWVR